MGKRARVSPPALPFAVGPAHEAGGEESPAGHAGKDDPIMRGPSWKISDRSGPRRERVACARAALTPTVTPSEKSAHRNFTLTSDRCFAAGMRPGALVYSFSAFGAPEILRAKIGPSLV